MEKENIKNIEREYVIPLRRKVSLVPRYKRTNKAVKTVKEFVARHMKVYDRDLNKIRIDKYLNAMLWSRGIRNPVSKIKVKAIKEGDIVRVEAAELPTNIKFKKMRTEKIESAAREIADKNKKQKVAEQEAQEAKETEKKTEEKKSEDEKKASVVEAVEKMEKEKAKEAKHTAKAKSQKEEKNAQTGYNASGRGH